MNTVFRFVQSVVKIVCNSAVVETPKIYMYRLVIKSEFEYQWILHLNVFCAAYGDVNAARADVKTQRYPAAVAIIVDDDVCWEFAVNIFVRAAVIWTKNKNLPAVGWAAADVATIIDIHVADKWAFGNLTFLGALMDFWERQSCEQQFQFILHETSIIMTSRKTGGG